MNPRPIAIGGQCAVYEAVRKSDGEDVVLKRLKDKRSRVAAARMRREVEALRAMAGPAFMPIIDWDAEGFKWYVMPVGRRSMAALARPIQKRLLLEIVRSVAEALRVAHGQGRPHRDVKPSNVIELVDDGERSRWVLADWGLTRRALGETTTPLTATSHVLGTEGFAPPEAYTNAHAFGAVGDIYSLGQLIAWATGAEIAPNVAAVAAEPWTSLVGKMNRVAPDERIQTVEEVVDLLPSPR